MSIDTLINNPIRLAELGGAISEYITVSGSGIVSLSGDLNISCGVTGLAGHVALKEHIILSQFTVCGDNSTIIHDSIVGGYTLTLIGPSGGSAAFNTFCQYYDNSQNGNSMTLYCNGDRALYPYTINFYDDINARCYLTFDVCTGYVGIGNYYPKSALSIGGLPEHANNAAAIAAGLATGDLYYTGVSGDGLMKITL